MVEGIEIRKRRKGLGLSAKELADILGVKEANIYKWEKGHKPNNPEEYLLLQRWLNGKFENVPHEKGRNLSTEGLSLTVDDYIREIVRQRDFAEDLVKNYITKIDTNLSTALGGVQLLTLHVESAREVVLDSLGRLEKKKPGALRVEADKAVERIMKERHALGKTLVKGK